VPIAKINLKARQGQSQKDIYSAARIALPWLDAMPLGQGDKKEFTKLWHNCHQVVTNTVLNPHRQWQLK
jgi:hypothetical protein